MGPAGPGSLVGGATAHEQALLAGNLPWWAVPASRVAGAPGRAPMLSSGSAALQAKASDTAKLPGFLPKGSGQGDGGGASDLARDEQLQHVHQMRTRPQPVHSFPNFSFIFISSLNLSF